jgi:hypothetical protein
MGILRHAIITAVQTKRTATSVDESMIQGGFDQYEPADIIVGYLETPSKCLRTRTRIIKMETSWVS